MASAFPPEEDVKVIYKFRDFNTEMVESWKDMFENYIGDRIQISKGDIFKGGPAADAIVSPANSFGFMDGGIDLAYSLHFGWQMQDRLQRVIQEDHDGELLVGNAIVIPTFEGGATSDSMKWSDFNDGQPIKYLISAPTMRVPLEVQHTVNAYSAFRAVILAVRKHNRQPDVDPITSVLCPGLGTAVGQMPHRKCAFQMLRAFETFDLGIHKELVYPKNLYCMYGDHIQMQEFGDRELHMAQVVAEVMRPSYARANVDESIRPRLSSDIEIAQELQACPDVPRDTM